MMRKIGAVSLLAMAIVFMAGCKPEEQGTAAYMGIEGNYLKSTVTKLDGKTVGYDIDLIQVKDGYTQQITMTVFDTIYPPHATYYQVTDGVVTIMKEKEKAQYPARFTDSFPLSPGAELKTDITYAGPDGEIKSCISTTKGTLSEVYCGGYGRVRSSGSVKIDGVARSAKSDLIYFEKVNVTSSEEAQAKFAAQINAALAMMMPVDDVETFKSWVKICPDHVETRNYEKLPPIGYASACGCVFKKERENVQTIIEYPDSPNPLGNGESAERFYASIRQCVDS